MTLASPPTTVRTLAVLALFAALLAACTTGGETSDGEPSNGETSDAEASESHQRDLAFDGPDEGALINAEELEHLSFAVTAPDDADAVADLVLRLDGSDITAEAEVAGDTLTYAPDTLPDGQREVTVAEMVGNGEASGGDGDVGEGEGEPEVLHTWRFEVQAEPPSLELTSP